MSCSLLDSLGFYYEESSLIKPKGHSEVVNQK